jgi:hypothetical protein
MTQRNFEPRIQTDETQMRRKRPKPQASKLRTAGILAGGLGLAYGGMRVGRAALAVERTAQAGEAAARRSAAAAENMRAITQGIRKTGAVVSAPFRGIGAVARKVRNVLRLRFSAESVCLRLSPLRSGSLRSALHKDHRILQFCAAQEAKLDHHLFAREDEEESSAPSKAQIAVKAGAAAALGGAALAHAPSVNNRLSGMRATMPGFASKNRVAPTADCGRQRDEG